MHLFKTSQHYYYTVSPTKNKPNCNEKTLITFGKRVTALGRGRDVTQIWRAPERFESYTHVLAAASTPATDDISKTNDRYHSCILYDGRKLHVLKTRIILSEKIRR